MFFFLLFFDNILFMFGKIHVLFTIFLMNTAYFSLSLKFVCFLKSFSKICIFLAIFHASFFFPFFDEISSLEKFKYGIFFSSQIDEIMLNFILVLRSFCCRLKKFKGKCYFGADMHNMYSTWNPILFMRGKINIITK